MARILVAGIYLADRKNTAAHLVYELAASRSHDVTQRWIAIAPGGRGQFDLPVTEQIITAPQPKFTLLEEVTVDAADFDWVLLCDDDIEVGRDFLDTLIATAERCDFALCQPARTADSFTDHPLVQIMPGIAARRTRFVEIGPLSCIRRDALPHLLPFGEKAGMGWGLDYIWPMRLEEAGLRLGIVDAAPLAHRIRRPVSGYTHAAAHRGMSELLASERHLSPEDAFSVLEVFV